MIMINVTSPKGIQFDRLQLFLIQHMKTICHFFETPIPIKKTTPMSFLSMHPIIYYIKTQLYTSYNRRLELLYKILKHGYIRACQTNSFFYMLVENELDARLGIIIYQDVKKIIQNLDLLCGVIEFFDYNLDQNIYHNFLDCSACDSRGKPLCPDNLWDGNNFDMHMLEELIDARNNEGFDNVHC